MPHLPNTEIIAQSKKWINDVVHGCNFCPFAGRELKRNSIHYEVLRDATAEMVLQSVAAAMLQLDEHADIETSLLILAGGFEKFDDYLDLLDLSEKLLVKENYEGIYQLAGFHPGYLFAGSNDEDAANYTNRSPYPMLHFLREASVSKAVDSYPGIDNVPLHNIEFARKKGLLYMQQLLAACMNETGK